MLPARHRLTLDQDFKRVFQQGHIYFSPGFNLKILFRPKPRAQSAAAEFLNRPARFGLVVSNKISLKATVRNRLKRQLRAIIQANLAKIKPNYDIIILAKPAATTFTGAELEQILMALLKQAGILI